ADFRGDVGGHDAVFGRGQVLHLGRNDVACRLQLVDGRAHLAALAGDVLDRVVDGRQRRAGVAVGGQVVGGQVHRGQARGGAALDVARAQRAHGDAYGGSVAGVAQEDRGGGSGEYVAAIEIGVAADVVDFSLDLGELIVERGQLRGRDRAVARLGGKGDGAVEEVGDLAERAVHHLQLAGAVVGVLRGLVQGGDVGLQAVGNGQASGVVGAAVDALTAGKAEEGGLQLALRRRQGELQTTLFRL